MKPTIKPLRIIAIVISAILSFHYSFSQYSSQGSLNGSVFSDDNSVGSFPFSIPGNAVTSDNNRSSANALLILLNGNTHYLKVTGFGFSIPALATITGIRVDVEKSAWDISILATVKDNDIKLVKSGSPVGDNKAHGSSTWTDTDAYDSYGDTTDMWGTTWTPTEINASDFGVVFSAKINGLVSLIPTARVDHIRITVFYIVALPIHFIDFKVEYKKDNDIAIKWTTAENDEKVSFIVQRSFNGIDWSDRYTLKAEISPGIKNYKYLDHITENVQRIYYRIKMILFSRAELYSKVVIADIDVGKKFSVFPNPSKGYVFVTYSGNNNINLLSLNGEKMRVSVEKINTNYVKIDASLLRPGLYIIQIGENKCPVVIL